MNAVVAVLLAVVLVVIGAGTAAAPGVSDDQRLANSEQQGWGAR